MCDICESAQPDACITTQYSIFPHSPPRDTSSQKQVKENKGPQLLEVGETGPC